MCKKILCVLLGICLVFSLSACGKKDDTSSKKPSNNKDNSSSSDTVNSNESVASDGDNVTDVDSDSDSDNSISDMTSILSGFTNVRRPDKPTAVTDDDDAETPAPKSPRALTEWITSKATGLKYKYVWSDEFEGNSVDYNKWCFGIESSTGSDNCLELTDKEDESIVGVRDGELQLNGRRYFDPNNSQIEYATSKSMSTRTTMNFKYGYVEMYAKVPHRRGAFPALWAIGKPGLVEKKNNDYYVEIDIFEDLAGGRIDSNFHKWYNTLNPILSTHVDPYYAAQYGGLPGITEYDYIDLTGVSETESSYEYHTYALEWTPEYLKTYYDDKCICTVDITVAYDKDWKDGVNGNAGKEYNIAVPEAMRNNMDGFHDYIYLILQNILFCNENGDQSRLITNDTVFPIEYHIEYIRLYQNPDVDNGLVYKDANGNVVDYYKK